MGKASAQIDDGEDEDAKEQPVLGAAKVQGVGERAGNRLADTAYEGALKVFLSPQGGCDKDSDSGYGDSEIGRWNEDVIAVDGGEDEQGQGIEDKEGNVDGFVAVTGVAVTGECDGGEDLADYQQNVREDEDPAIAGMETYEQFELSDDDEGKGEEPAAGGKRGMASA